MNYYLLRYDSSISILLLFIGFLLVIIAQIKISLAYSKYKKISNAKGITGSEVARKILDANGLTNIEIFEISGNLTDHYNPSKKMMNLSKEIYSGTSVAAVAVAAHECGHAIQDKENYIFLKIRTLLVPIVNFISYLGYFGLIISLIGGITKYIEISIIILLFTILFELVTLPVELNASKRAKEELENLNLIYEEEEKGVRKVLSAAAMTYVASLLSSILNVLRLILILNRRND